jgi:hypothetical protein
MHEGRDSRTNFIAWFDKQFLKINVTKTRYSCVYRAAEYRNLTEEQAINLSGASVWCSMSSKGMSEPLFFQATVTGTAYLPMPKDDNTLHQHIVF